LFFIQGCKCSKLCHKPLWILFNTGNKFKLRLIVVNSKYKLFIIYFQAGSMFISILLLDLYMVWIWGRGFWLIWSIHPPYSGSKSRQSQHFTLRQKVSRAVSLGVKPQLGPKIRFFYFQTIEVVSMWGAFSDERTSLSFVAMIAVHDIYIYKFTCPHST
jgi:hypothetical protein